MPAKKRTAATRKAVTHSPLAKPPIPPLQCGRCGTWYGFQVEDSKHPGVCPECVKFMSQTGEAPFD